MTKFFQPPEWFSHSACWVAWPCASDLWEEDLAPAQSEFVQLCKGIQTKAPHHAPSNIEILKILVRNKTEQKEAEEALKSLNVEFYEIPYGDIWVRDTGPIFTIDENEKVSVRRFAFNGWGEKYLLPSDERVASRISEVLIKKMPSSSYPFILEGGSIEPDEFGTCLTTEQCLLNPNRNRGTSKEEIETLLAQSLGFQKILWLKQGLMNDHTDGHIDTIARFAPGGRVICMRATEDSDPNARILEDISKQLSVMQNAAGQKIEVIEIPSPGKIQDEEGFVMPASYVNFYISNTSVVVPAYGSSYDEAAREAISKCFPDRVTISSSARHILTGGGAFHCITQQEPTGEILKVNL